MLEMRVYNEMFIGVLFSLFAIGTVSLLVLPLHLKAKC